jgi:hypothetical protein
LDTPIAAHETDLLYQSLIRSYVDAPHFVQRSWLVERIEAELAEPYCRFLLLSANPGAGKTALMAWLARQHPDWPRYFIRRDSRTRLSSADARSFLFAIGHQLAATNPSIFGPGKLEVVVKMRIDELKAKGKVVGIRVEDLYVSPFYQTSLRVEQSIGNVAGELEGISAKRLVAEPRFLELENLQHLAILDPAKVLLKEKPEARIVILVDAVDELRYYRSGDTILDWLASCPELPENVRIVISSRRDDSLLDVLRERRQAELRELKIDPLSQQVQTDLRTYALRFATQREVGNSLAQLKLDPNQFVTEAVKRAQGNFQYLATLARGIVQASRNKDEQQLRRLLELRDVPAGLEDLYAFFLKLIRNGIQNQVVEIPRSISSQPNHLPAWEGLYLPLFGILAVAAEPLTVPQLIRFSSTAAKEHWVHGALERIGQFLDRDNGRYRLYHSTFQEFLTGIDTQTTHSNLYLDPAEWHRRIAGYYRGSTSSWSSVIWTEVDDYGLLHLPRHLAMGRLFPDLYELIEDRGWYEAKRDFDPSLLSYANDIELVLAHVERSETPDLAYLVAYSLLLASVKSLLKQVPLETLDAMTQLGKSQQALRYLYMIPRPDRRLWALGRIIEILVQMNANALGLEAFSDLQRQAEGLDESLKARLGSPPPLPQILDAIKTATTRCDDEFINLGPLTREASDLMLDFIAWQWPAFSRILNAVEFSRPGKETHTKEEEFALTVLKLQIMAKRLRQTDHDHIRAVVAESAARIGKTSLALALLPHIESKVHKLETLSLVAQAFAQQQDRHSVELIWDCLRTLDVPRYREALTERTGMLLRMTDSLWEVGATEQSDLAFSKAMSLLTQPAKPIDSIRVIRDASIGASRRGERRQAEFLLAAAREFLDDPTRAFWGRNPPGDRIKAMCFVAQIHLALGQTTEALSGIQSALQLARKIDESSVTDIYASMGVNFGILRAEALAAVAQTLAMAKESERAAELLSEALDLCEILVDGHYYDRFIGAWAESLVQSVDTQDALRFAALIKGQPVRAAIYGHLSRRFAEKHDFKLAGELADEALQHVSQIDTYVGRAEALSNLMVGLELEAQGKSEPNKRALELFDQFLALTRSTPNEPEAIECTLMLIEKCTEEGHREWAWAVCEAAKENVPKYAVFLSGFLRALCRFPRSPKHSDLYQSVGATAIQTVQQQMPQDTYHYPLALLMIECGLRLGIAAESNEAQEQLGNLAKTADYLEQLGISSLSKLASRDGDVGDVRALSVLRLAAGLKEFPSDVFSRDLKADLFTWRWLKGEACKGRQKYRSAQDIRGALQSVRSWGRAELWNLLADSAPLIVEVGAAASTWERIQAVESLFHHPVENAAVAESNDVKENP